ncbi:hypothetical protein, partial [Salmonella enterica]|uniref:hypothetical protein n=1 Tax=Salmonella enterica TaxID=28901 RepID=UPI0032998ED3
LISAPSFAIPAFPVPNSRSPYAIGPAPAQLPILVDAAEVAGVMALALGGTIALAVSVEVIAGEPA